MKDEKAVILRRIKKCHRRIKAKKNAAEEQVRMDRLKARWRELTDEEK